MLARSASTSKQCHFLLVKMGEFLSSMQVQDAFAASAAAAAAASRESLRPNCFLGGGCNEQTNRPPREKAVNLWEKTEAVAAHTSKKTYSKGGLLLSLHLKPIHHCAKSVPLLSSLSKSLIKPFPPPSQLSIWRRRKGSSH